MRKTIAGELFGSSGNNEPGSAVRAVTLRPPPRKRDEAIVLARLSAGDLGADAGLDHVAGLVQLPPEEMHSGFGRAILRHAVGLADHRRFHGSIPRSFP